MNSIRKISRKISAGKIVSAVMMMLLLVFLTCINQFIYSSPDKDDVAVAWNSNDKDPGPCYPNGPAGPDEKSPDAPVSIEEFIHEHQSPVNPFWANALFEHLIHEADKLCVVHFEIHSPPPLA
jgi:hypothetical protein